METTSEKTEIQLTIEVAEKYTTISHFEHGFAVVSIKTEVTKSDKSGTYSANKYGIIDSLGKEISKCIWDSVEIISNKLFVVYDLQKRYSFLDENSKIIYDWMDTKPQMIVLNDKTFYIINRNKVIDSNFRDLKTFNGLDKVTYLYEGMFIVEKQNKEALIVIKGEFSNVSNDWFDDIRPVDKENEELRSYFYVTDKNTIAVFNKDGLVIPWTHSIKYDNRGKFFRIIDFTDSGRVSLFYLHTKTQSDWYDEIRGGWSEYLSPAKKDGYWGFVDVRDGKLVIPCQYHEVRMFNINKIAKVKVKNDFFSFTNWISINTKGEEVNT
jgi:hypothetical protein